MEEPILVRYSDDALKKEYVLARLVRYNNRSRLQDESVAVHSFFVTLFTLRILDDLSVAGMCDDRLRSDVLTRAILHDVGEVVTSDIPYDVKHSSSVITEELTKMERCYLSRDWPISFDRCVRSNDELCHAILKLADTYSVLQYCAHEMDLGNVSVEMREIYEDADGRCAFWLNKTNELASKYITREESESDDNAEEQRVETCEAADGAEVGSGAEDNVQG